MGVSPKPSMLCEVLDSVERPVGAIMAWGGWATSSTLHLHRYLEVDWTSWENWSRFLGRLGKKKVGFLNWEKLEDLFYLTDVNNVRKMVDVTFGAVLCKVAPSTSLSQSMLGCRAVYAGSSRVFWFYFDLPCSSPSNWYPALRYYSVQKIVEYSRLQDLYTKW